MDHRCALLGSHLRGDRARLTTTGTGTVTSACCLVRLDNCLRDASAVVHLVSVLPSPVADCSRLLTVRTSGLLVGRLGPTTAAVPRPPADLASGFDEGGQGLVELFGVRV